jgi:hypothetical protein
LRYNDESVSSVVGVEECQNGFRVPVLLRLVLFLGQFTSKAHSLFLFLLFRVFLLVFLHLELHHFDAPLAIGKVFDKVSLMIVDIFRVGLFELVDPPVGAAD